MKRLKLLFLSIMLLFLTSCHLLSASNQELTVQTTHSGITHSLSPKVIPERFRFKPIDSLKLQADSAILIHLGSGEVLFDKNSHESKGVASMSKIMSELLVLEAIEENNINWDSPVKISKYAQTISHQPGFATINLKKDKAYTVQELFYGMAVTSANGATIALAETVAGSEKEFVKQMNDKAKVLGLNNTYFVNSTGLTNSDLKDYHSTGTLDDYNKMSAFDLAVLAQHIIEHYPNLLDMTSLATVDIEGATYDNSNWMLPEAKANFLGLDLAFPGVNGLKTGFTSEAGYGFTGTVDIDGSRLISVVIGTDAVEERFIETAKLYNAVLKQINNK